MEESSSELPFQIRCSSSTECTNVTNAECLNEQCGCGKSYPVYINAISKCLHAVKLNATCNYDEQCLDSEAYSKCDDKTNLCVCLPGYNIRSYGNIGASCVKSTGKSGNETVDHTMIVVLVVFALMFIIICVVLRLFSKARFRENRSIFNTPNPRLMNASLFKDRRRGSTLSTASATGSAAGAAAAAPASAKASSPKPEEKELKETTVAIETVD